MKTVLTFMLLSFLVAGCKEEIRLPFGKSSSKKSVPDGGSSSSNNTGMTSQQPQPVQGTGNGNGTMDRVNPNVPEISQTMNAARYNKVVEQFELAEEQERVVTTSEGYSTVSRDFRLTSFDWLSQYEAWNALDLPSQMTIFAPYAVLYFDTAKTPEHLLMYISQTDQGVFTINLQIIPSKYTDYSHVLKLLSDGVSPVFTKITIANEDQVQIPFILNMEKFRNNKPLQPYSTEQQLDPDEAETRLVESLTGSVSGDRTTSTALGTLLLCKENLETVLVEGSEADTCKLEEKDFNLQFAFDLEGNFLIRFLSVDGNQHKMIASVSLTSDKIILEKNKKIPANGN